MLRIFPTYPFRVQHSNQITNSVTLLSCRCRTTATESTHTANDPSLNFSVLTLFNLIQCLIGLLLLNIHIYTICTFTVPHPPLSVSIESVEYLNLPPTRPGRRRFASAIPGKQAILHVPTNSNPYQENRLAQAQAPPYHGPYALRRELVLSSPVIVLDKHRTLVCEIFLNLEDRI